MLKRTPIAPLLIVFALLAGQAAGQVDDKPANPEKTPVPSEGFWPTSKMVDLAIDRITEEMSGKYDFDEYQLQKTREIIKEQIPRWMNENRGELQTLFNQFVEVQLNDEPPKPEDVAKWAQRALGMFDQFKGIVTTTGERMREYLNEDQISTLEGELAAFDVGSKFVSNKLGGWAEGRYDPKTEWIRDQKVRHDVDVAQQRKLESEMESERTKAIARAKGEPIPPETQEPEQPVEVQPVAAATEAPAAPKSEVPRDVSTPQDEWSRYVAWFKNYYELTPEQIQKADTFLAAQRKSRADYLSHKGADLERIQQKFRIAKEKEQLDAAEKEYQKLQEPIVGMFSRLKEKLETLPTRAQRKKAAEKGPEQKWEAVSAQKLSAGH
ncbi:MAG: hypothetical protein U1D55_04020 [Phycisphaerae bacterium]